MFKFRTSDTIPRNKSTASVLYCFFWKKLSICLIRSVLEPVYHCKYFGYEFPNIAILVSSSLLWLMEYCNPYKHTHKLHL